jgi:hypothetical protein
MQLRRTLVRKPSVILEKHDFTYQYAGQDIPYTTWLTGDKQHVENIVFLGTVQIGRLPGWIAQSCPKNTAIIPGALHWLAEADGSDIPEFMYQYTKHAFLSAIAAVPADRQVDIIVDSQAAPSALSLLARKKYASRVRSIVLAQPLGLNASSMGGTAAERLVVFKKRVLQNLRYQVPSLLSDPRLIYNHRLMLKTVGFDNDKSNAQYGAGLAYDATDDLRGTLVAGVRAVVVCGQNDMMFPAGEIRKTLAARNLAVEVRVVPGVPHSPLATRHGRKLLRHAFEALAG